MKPAACCGDYLAVAFAFPPLAHVFDNILHNLIDCMEAVAKSFPLYAPGGPNGHRYSGKARREKRKKLAMIKQVMEIISL